MKSDRRFYVYAYFEPESDLPFYIGKGAGRRAYDHIEPRSLSLKTFFLSKLKGMLDRGVEPRIEFLHNDLTEAEAFVIERELIARYGRRDLGTGCLCNLTDGGDGASGCKPSPETVEKRASKMRGRKRPPAVIEKIAATHRGRKQRPEVIAARAAAKRGRKWPTESVARVTGRKRSKQATEKIVSALTGRKRPPEVNAKVALSKHRPVMSIDPKTGVKTIYPSAIEATRVGYTKSGISTCCNGKAKLHRGLVWRFVDTD